ncbi:YcxB family protein [Miniphocaeibacter massiliensis]|uniref:YcxB family protein n=1 Tax=Miniphocaeibacter massiliensis TaxID=2041841 RepID=UPI000C1BDBD2|nr:YcxB family protein [Miniphocaeibacter massiliensis]
MIEEEVLYVNEYENNEEDIEKFIGCITLKQRLLSLGMGILAFGLAISKIIEDDKVFATVLLVIGVIGSYIFFTLKNTTLKDALKSINLNKHMILEFYKEHFIIKDGERESIIKYKDLEQVVEKEDYFYLMVDKNRGIIIKKDSFKDDDENEFSKFINTKVKFNKKRTSVGG